MSNDAGAPSSTVGAEDEKDQQQNKEKKHDSGAADLEKACIFPPLYSAMPYSVYFQTLFIFVTFWAETGHATYNSALPQPSSSKLCIQFISQLCCTRLLVLGIHHPSPKKALEKEA